MRRLSLLFVLLVVIVGVNVDRPRAAGPSVTFHAIGDLPGGGFTTVISDATRDDGVIYAVGGAVSRRPCTAPCGATTDTPVFWRSDSGVLQPLPADFVTNTASNALTAYAITPDAAYIASQWRTVAGEPGSFTFLSRAVRITTATLATLDLDPLASASVATGAARALSANGTIVYGFNGQGQGVRFDTTAFPPTQRVIEPIAAAHTSSPVAPRGSSTDGNVAVGVSFGGGLFQRGYRYEHGPAGGVSAVPLIEGGTSNSAIAVSPDGDLVLVYGNSTAYPNGEIYLWRESTNTLTSLGSPNAAWSPGGRVCARGTCVGTIVDADMTADGAVIASSFTRPGPDFSPDQSAYFRNTHGWFHLTSALAANGVNVVADGWNPRTLLVRGISPDGSLVFGAGERCVAGSCNVEGFVADFGSADIALKDFNPAPVAPTGANTSIVGAWTDNFNNPKFAFVFTDDGVYYHIEDMPNGYGFERGFYAFDGTSIEFTTLLDTNGSKGASGANGLTLPATLSFNQLTFAGGTAHRIVGSTGTFIGSWVSGDPTLPASSFVAVLLANGVIFQASDELFGGTYAGKALYTFTSSNCPALLPGGLECYQLDITDDTGNFVGLSPDGLTGTALDDDGESINILKRVIDPAAIPVIANTPLVVNGVQGQAIAPLDVNANLPVTFFAQGLPTGLGIDSNTGVISGTPTAGGQFVATIRALSAVGVADVEPLTLTIAIPTPIGSNVTVEPVVTEGQGEITLTFDEVTSGGETTVEAVSLDDLEDEGVPPPGNVDVGGVIYNVETTASFTGLVELCFSYEGIDFGTAEPRLFHFENNAWVDITTTVDTVNKIICGATTSLSPFAILKSDIVRKGFYAPLNPIAGFLNTVKAGSTVPLKFEVFVSGVEKTTTTGIEVSTQAISCDAEAPEDPVEITQVLGGAGLRYDSAAGYFVLNWKVPSAKGCYQVQVKTTQDQLALTARFKAN